MRLHLFGRYICLAPFVDHLWQSTFVALLALLLALVLRRNRGAVRYWVWLIASIKFLVPFSLFVYAGRALRPLAIAPVQMPPQISVFTTAVDQIVRPFSQSRPDPPYDPSLLGALRDLVPYALVSLWLCGSLAILFYWWRERRRVRRAIQTASPSTICSEIPVLFATVPLEPGIFGIFKPALLLPQGIADRLTPPQLRAIITHEICHVRRRDNFTSALHMLVEALFWFHPLVWWIGGRLVHERESACDELVLTLGNDRQVYAESILKVCEFYLESPLRCAAGATGSNLKKRIETIMIPRPALHLTRARTILLAAAVIFVALSPFGLGLLRATQSPAPTYHPDGISLLHSNPAFQFSFKSATIKPSKDQSAGPFSLSVAATGLTTVHSSLRDLIRFAYHAKSYDQIVGGPDWISAEFYDLTAVWPDDPAADAATQKLPADLQPEVPRLIMQSFLADRFQLNAAVETRDLPVYALVAAGSGPKLKEVARTPGARTPSLTTPPNRVVAVAMDMHTVADFLSIFPELGGRLIVDETGLKGFYDFEINGVSPSPSKGPNVTPIFTALQDQLGLKLEPRQATGGQVLLIRHATHPSLN